MTTLRRFALGFPVTSWSHRRGYSLESVATPGKGPYYVQWDPGSGVYGEDWTGAPRDRNGVLLSGGNLGQYHPIRIAQFALHRFQIWNVTRDPQARADVLAQADWLRDKQQLSGVRGIYKFEFPWRKYGAFGEWSSAMAQGEAISVLLRAHTLEPYSGYDEGASRAALPFRRDIREGGVVWKDGDDVFFEEIANEHAPHVLNGCIFALWGLWELWKTTGDSWQGSLVERCVDTLERRLPAYDTGWWTLYSLMRSASGIPHVATLKYHQFHVAQMHVLARMFGRAAFEDAAKRWTQYANQRTCRSRLVAATMRSLPDRFLGRDTVVGGAHT